jgi:RNA polymerase sigma-70 factor (ECF subfamily)
VPPIDDRCEIFERLYARYSRGLYAFLYHLLGERTAAEDILQETFLRALKGYSHFKAQAKISTWLYTIARNLALSYLKSRKRREKVTAGPMRLIKAQDAAAEVMQKEMLEKLQEAMGRLSPKHREVLLLKLQGDLTYREIAEIIGSRIGTVRSRFHYAISALRGILKPNADSD